MCFGMTTELAMSTKALSIHGFFIVRLKVPEIKATPSVA